MDGFVSIPPTSLWLHHGLLYLPQEAMPQRCYAENAIGGGAATLFSLWIRYSRRREGSLYSTNYFCYPNTLLVYYLWVFQRQKKNIDRLDQRSLCRGGTACCSL